MSKKTSTKAKGSVASRKGTKPAVAGNAAEAKQRANKGRTKGEQGRTENPHSECPKGGQHEWADENGEQYCGKCKEPKEVKAPRSIVAKTAGEKKVSAIDAAAKLLAEATAPMNCVEMIEAMASKGLWQSPGGKTPHATLYSAIIREIGLKGDAARFVKAERGRFTIKA